MKIYLEVRPEAHEHAIKILDEEAIKAAEVREKGMPPGKNKWLSHKFEKAVKKMAADPSISVNFNYEIKGIGKFEINYTDIGQNVAKQIPLFKTMVAQQTFALFKRELIKEFEADIIKINEVKS